MTDTYLIIDRDSYRDEDKSWFVKIGRSRNPRGRVAGFRTGNPGNLELLATIPGGDWERLLHATFAQFRGNGEWFRLDMGRIVLVATLASEHPEGWIDYDAFEALPKPSMQAEDECCMLESVAFLEGWDVGEAYALSDHHHSKLRVA